MSSGSRAGVSIFKTSICDCEKKLTNFSKTTVEFDHFIFITSEKGSPCVTLGCSVKNNNRNLKSENFFNQVS